jgi:hypothetical protein
MKYIKFFENFDSPYPEINDLVDCLTEVFDKYDIKQIKSPDKFDDFIDFSLYATNIEGNRWFISNKQITIFDIGSNIHSIYNSILDIKETIESRLKKDIFIRIIDNGHNVSRSNAIIIFPGKLER